MLSSLYWRSKLMSQSVKRHWQVLEQFSALAPDAARADLSRRLLEQIRHFASRGDALPEWREAAAIRDPADLWRIWSDLPILTKQDLQTRFSPTELRTRWNVQGIASSTGGSTGEPTPFMHDLRMCRATNALRLYCRQHLGWRPGMAIICIWGSERDIGRPRRLRSRMSARLRNQWLVDGYQLNSQTTDRVLSLIRHHRQVAIYGFTSMLEYVARDILGRGDLPPTGAVRAAWNGGEMLYENQVEVFQQAFGAPLLNMYGGRELSSMAYQLRTGASLNVLRPFLFVEIVDEAGRPVAPGESGRLIWTSTVCRATPFLRYDIGDLGTSGPGDQDEAGICRLTSLHGRHAGLLTLPSGKTISVLFWNHLFKEFPEVAQFQVVLRGNDGVEFRLRGRPFTSARELQLRGILASFLGQLPMTITWVESIPLTKQGKLLQVIREAA